MGVYEALRTLLAGFSECVGSGKLLEQDLELAAKILSGALDAKVAHRALVGSMLKMGSNLRRGLHKRPGQSIDNLDEAEIQEVIVYLAGTKGQNLGSARHLLKSFGLNAQSVKTMNFQSELLPQFYCAWERPTPA